MTIVAEKYSKGAYLQRNMSMVNESDLVIAVYDGRDGGGTAFTIRNAKAKEKEVHIISVSR